MRKIFLFILTISSLSAFGQAQSLSRTVVRYRVQDSTAARGANDALHDQGYADMMFNNEATTPHWDIWNGSDYDHVFDFGGGGEAVLDWYSLKANGGAGDGVTDDTEAFQDLVDAVPVGSTIYLPTGSFLLSSQVTINKRINLVGNGLGSEITTAAGNIDLIYYTDGTNQLSHFQIKNLRFINTATTPSAGSAIRCNRSVRVVFEDLHIDNFYRNIRLDDCAWWSVSRCIVVGPVDYGLYIANTTAGFYDIGDHSIVDSQFLPDHRDSNGGIYQRNSGGLKVTNAKFNHGNGFRFDYSYFYDGNQTTPDIQFSNCSFENFDVNALKIQAATIGQLKNVQISNCHFNLGASASKAIAFNKVRYASVMGNVFTGNGSGSTVAIDVTDSDGIKAMNQYSGYAVGNTFVLNGSNTDCVDLSPITGSGTLNFGDLATLTSETLTITVTGAAVGDVVNLGVPNGSMTAGLIFFAWVSAVNTVSVQCYNSTTGNINPASGTFKATIQSKF